MHDYPSDFQALIDMLKIAGRKHDVTRNVMDIGERWVEVYSDDYDANEDSLLFIFDDGGNLKEID
jgi:hypothetical protein